jgi:hypothetical protein
MLRKKEATIQKTGESDISIRNLEKISCKKSAYLTKSNFSASYVCFSTFTVIVCKVRFKYIISKITLQTNVCFIIEVITVKV